MFKNQYKEITYVKEILENGFTSKHLLHEMKLLVKHFKEEGNDEEIRKHLLYDFCEQNIPNFNKVVFYKTINNALKYVINKDEKLVEINDINVSGSEIGYIENLSLNDNLKKLVFTLLVLTKLNKKYLELRDGNLKNNEYYFGGHNNYMELTSCSKITFDKKKGLKNIHDLIRELGSEGIVEIVGKGNIKLSFMYEIKDDCSEGILIDRFSVIGYYYDKYKGDKRVRKCEECKILIKTNGNRTKYCNDCWKEIRRKYKTIKQREYRENVNVDV